MRNPFENLRGMVANWPNEVAPERGERLDDPWEALIKHFLIARKQHDLSSAFHGSAAIAIELKD